MSFLYFGSSSPASHARMIPYPYSLYNWLFFYSLLYFSETILYTDSKKDDSYEKGDQIWKLKKYSSEIF